MGLGNSKEIDQKIEELEKRVESGEDVSEETEESSEETESNNEPQGEETPEELDVFGRKVTREQWDKMLENDENVSGMVAAHTRRSQDLSQRERDLERARSDLENKLREFEHVRSLASNDPEAATRYLAGDPEAATEKQESDLRNEVREVKETLQAEQKRRAMAALQGTVIKKLKKTTHLKDDPEEHVEEVLKGLFTDRSVSLDNYTRKADELIESLNEKQKKREARILAKYAESKEKGKRMTVPKTADARSPTPKAKAAERISPRRDGSVDWDAVDEKAVAFLEERNRREG
ncbi:MAG: hypothetical protein GY937_20190 [bacterium]|nr:hypothetical protein [bacterium]